MTPQTDWAETIPCHLSLSVCQTVSSQCVWVCVSSEYKTKSDEY